MTISNPIDLVQFDSGSPDTNYVRIEAKPDGRLYSVTPAGVETLLGGGSAPIVVSATLAAAQGAITLNVIPGLSIVIPPGKSATITAIGTAQGSATAGNQDFGLRVSQAAGANGNAVGSVKAQVSGGGAAGAAYTTRGNNVSVAGGASVDVISTIANTNTAFSGTSASAVIFNTSTNADTTVSVLYRGSGGGVAAGSSIFAIIN